MRGKAYRRFSIEFSLGVVETCLAGDKSMNSLATKAGVDHSLVHYWLKKYHAGELTLDAQREEDLIETSQRWSARSVSSRWSWTC